MIDFHAHVLPCVDDGSRDVAESLSMLDAMQAQGVSCVMATPHFYANDESVDAFLERRAAAMEALRERPPNSPDIRLGAEVRYYEGISRLADLSKLRIQDSRLMLLEMPFAPWSEYAVREVVDIASQGKIIPVLAHVERYLFLQKKNVASRLLECGVLFQTNASFLIERRHRRRALSMIANGQLHFIGSDCHNLKSRPPNVADAYAILEKKHGTAFTAAFTHYQCKLLSQQ